MSIPISRRATLGVAAGILLAPTAAARAAQPYSNPVHQVPGVLRWTVGDITVTAISDGYSSLPLSVVPQAKPMEADSLAREAFIPPGELPIAINTYLIESGGVLALVDTGGRGHLGPHAGMLQANLAAAGVKPRDIDLLILTHLHVDHVAGMTAPDGSAMFPNATLIVHQAELAYWNNDFYRSRVPVTQTEWFGIARDAVAPYVRTLQPITQDGQSIMRGVTAMALPGHTPGHTGLHVASGNERLLIWGDIVHLPHLQFPEPGWGLAFDVDIDQAARTRARIFDMTTTDRLAVCGMHLSFPGFGHVVTRAAGGYGFVPSTWRYDVG